MALLYRLRSFHWLQKNILASHFELCKAARSYTSIPSSNSLKMNCCKLLFPGQGSQYVGMTTKLQPLSLPSEELFSTASKVLGYDLKDVCINGPQEKLEDTVYCQPAVVIASLVALEHLKATQPEKWSHCVAMAGFSVGELTALIAAEALPLEKGLELVKLRAESMQIACDEQNSGMITIIGLDESFIIKLCQDVTENTEHLASIANYIFPKGLVISASKGGLELVREKALKLGALSVKNVPVSGGFHSSFMSSAVPKLQKALEKIDVKQPLIPVYCNVTGQPYTSLEEIKKYLAEQVVKPVYWEQCVRHMIATQGETEFVEVGPGKQLKSMLKRINRISYDNCLNIQS